MRAMVSHSTAPIATKSRMMFATEKDHQQDDEDGEGQGVHDVDDAHHEAASSLPPKNPRPRHRRRRW
jgi:hypothetical protein